LEFCEYISSTNPLPVGKVQPLIPGQLITNLVIGPFLLTAPDFQPKASYILNSSVVVVLNSIIQSRICKCWISYPNCQVVHRAIAQRTLGSLCRWSCFSSIFESYLDHIVDPGGEAMRTQTNPSQGVKRTSKTTLLLRRKQKGNLGTPMRATIIPYSFSSGTAFPLAVTNHETEL